MIHPLQKTPKRLDPRVALWRRRRGFSFVEVLFAVMILGIGFIMIAAIFPVALTQTKATNEEAHAASLARGAINYIEPRATNATLEATDNVVVAADYDPRQDGSLFDALQANMIPPIDQRIAWVVLYRRAGPVGPAAAADSAEPYAQVYLFPVQARNSSTYFVPPQVVHDVSGNVNARGRSTVRASIVNSTNPSASADTLTFSAGDFSAAVAGAFVIIADADPGGTQPILRSAFNGHIYRLGNQISNNQFELAPGNDFTPENLYDANGARTTISAVNNAAVFVIGRGVNGAGTFEGAGQDISAFTSFVQVR